MTPAQAYAARWDLSPNPTPRPIPIIPRQATAEQPYPHPSLSVRPLTSQCSLPNSVVTVYPPPEGGNNGSALASQDHKSPGGGQRASVSFERTKEGAVAAHGGETLAASFPCTQTNCLVSQA